MDISKNKNENSTDEASKCIPVLSEHAKALEGIVNERYIAEDLGHRSWPRRYTDGLV